jgi:hypothetical protein
MNSLSFSSLKLAAAPHLATASAAVNKYSQTVAPQLQRAQAIMAPHIQRAQEAVSQTLANSGITRDKMNSLARQAQTHITNGASAIMQKFQNYQNGKTGGRKSKKTRRGVRKGKKTRRHRK